MKRVDICSYTIGEDSVKAIIEERLNTSMETRPLAMTDNGKELIHWSERMVGRICIYMMRKEI